MNTDSIVTKSPDHMESDLGADLVLMTLDDGHFFSLAGTGRRAWELIGAGTRIGELADRLTCEYEVDRATCERELMTLIGDLAGRGLVDVAD